MLATVVYAVPPAVRLTNHGLRSVPVVMNEVGESFGCTSWQQLVKVQLPIARRTILLGLNQVIMMAFGIVVIGSLLGTGDIGGRGAARACRRTTSAPPFAAGLAIVFAAIALDRITTGERHKATSLERAGAATAALRFGGCSPACVLAVTLVTRLVGWSSFPDVARRRHQAGRRRRIVDWVSDNLRNGVPIIGGTQSISDFLVTDVLEPLREFLVWLPWLVVVVVCIGVIGWLSGGWRLALTVAGCMFAIAVMGDVPGGAGGRTTMWDHAMDTLSQVIVALVHQRADRRAARASRRAIADRATACCDRCSTPPRCCRSSCTSSPCCSCSAPAARRA